MALISAGQLLRLILLNAAQRTNEHESSVEAKAILSWTEMERISALSMNTAPCPNLEEMR